MIYTISGHVLEKNESFIVIDVHGIGYQVFIPTTVLQTVPNVNDSIRLFTFHYIREDQQVLYGFSTAEERELFVKLTSVSGIGPKVGLKMLSAFTGAQLIQCIITGNIAQLTQIPGIGKKGAERLVIELKDKLPSLHLDDSQSPSLDNNSFIHQHSLTKDLTLALKSLGYHQDEIKRAFSKSKETFSDNLSLEDGIKLLLKHL